MEAIVIFIWKEASASEVKFWPSPSVNAKIEDARRHD
jgi:hypothetical protein